MNLNKGFFPFQSFTVYTICKNLPKTRRYIIHPTATSTAEFAIKSCCTFFYVNLMWYSPKKNCYLTVHGLDIYKEGQKGYEISCLYQRRSQMVQFY